MPCIVCRSKAAEGRCLEHGRFTVAVIGIKSYCRSQEFVVTDCNVFFQHPRRGHSANIVKMAPSISQVKDDGSKNKTPLQLISQGPSLPGIPKHPTIVAQRQWLLERMALAFRLFARLGYTDGMAGHISVRDPENSHAFWTVRVIFLSDQRAYTSD